jgi:hypothetical protein
VLQARRGGIEDEIYGFSARKKGGGWRLMEVNGGKWRRMLY